ncbi:MAG: O-linked N-acetylglucosamine transferase, SPINDLY family protein, partial [Prochlorothrix sp.]
MQHLVSAFTKSPKLIQDLAHQLGSLSHYSIFIQQCQDFLERPALIPGAEAAEVYWLLGLALLLEGQEWEAQLAWMQGLDGEEEEKSETRTHHLSQVLDQAATWQASLGRLEMAWTIRQHLRELQPNSWLNFLKLLDLSCQLHLTDPETIEQLGLLDPNLAQDLAPPDSSARTEIYPILEQIAKQAFLEPWLLSLFRGITPFLEPLPALNLVMMTASEAAHSAHNFPLAITYAEYCLEIDPRQPEVLSHLATFHRELGQFDTAIDIAQRIIQTAQTPLDQINAVTVLIQSLLGSGGRWYEVLPLVTVQKQYLYAFIQEKQIINRIFLYRLLNCTFFLNYIQDNPSSNNYTRHQVLKFCQHNIQANELERSQRYAITSSPYNQSSGKLKIGYLCHCFREHSVGWLARWLYQHHCRESFEIYTYFATYRTHMNSNLQQWYEDHSDHTRRLGNNGLEIADQIHQDNLNLLVELDSLTADISCEALALKPAPIQATWLGWDASGLPAIDYYIADNYALPNSAQSYYQEKLWRLPNTYLQVDGFEVGIPTISRHSLNIPNDAVIYLSAQSGLKRNPDNLKLQLAILRQVPNSYFLIKDLHHEFPILREFLEGLVASEGLSMDRVRFLGKVPSSHIHRANLGIADVVLDTYPYNGATTTLETLWMGVPLVTRVGQQFSARNSYTFMMNAGITEGIAWTDEEYVEWGIRLGTDE